LPEKNRLRAAKKPAQASTEACPHAISAQIRHPSHFFTSKRKNFAFFLFFTLFSLDFFKRSW
jgi:hypothetical protein